MFIINADLPYVPQEVLERDVSQFQFASTKLPKLKDLPPMISTHKITIGSFKGAYAHIGYYDKGGAIKKKPMVVTIINDQNGIYQAGTQLIFYGKDVMRESNTWVWEEIKGIKYMRHNHKDFFVYSIDSEQFIIKR